MCGFIGVLSDDPAQRDADILNKMSACISHRGPDDSGIFTSGRVALAFRRLSVIDLAAGHQPMLSHDSRYAITFNGEIYNFQELRAILESDYQCQFSTHSDTEVILHAYATWGTNCFARFNGMFAIALWDEHTHQLTLARDRAGKKPLYTYRSGNTTLLASEIKALLAHPACNARADQARVATSLAYRYVPRFENLFEDIEALPAGHWIQIGPGSEHRPPVPFWTPTVLARSGKKSTSTPAHNLKELTTLLSNSVRRRLVADVPVGAFLSGGVDSSLIVALMSRDVGSSLNTFSIGFDTGVSEHEHARFVARQFDTIHHETIIKAEHLLEQIPAVLWHRESPVSEPSDIPLYILAREARKHVTVVLSGEGSDELFGGYPKYVAEHYLRKYTGPAAHKIARTISKALPLGESSSPAGLALASLAQPNRFDAMARWFGAFGFNNRQRLLSKELLQHSDSIHAYARDIAMAYPGASWVTQLQLQDFFHWLPANLLLRGDRVTMAHSLELRCPFLDPEIIDFAFSLPDNQKIRGGTSKWIVRRIADELLPPAISRRKKWGFKVPVGEWFRGPLKHALKSTLLSSAAIRRGYFNVSQVERLVKDHINGEDHSKQLWYLFQLELWHLMFIDKTLNPTDSLQ